MSRPHLQRRLARLLEDLDHHALWDARGNRRLRSGRGARRRLAHLEAGWDGTLGQLSAAAELLATAGPG